MRRYIVVSLLICFLLNGCSRGNLSASTHHQSQNPIVTMTLDNEEMILIELYPESAPNTVNNFISLIEDGYYDGLSFHRIIDNYIIQSGDPLMNNYGSPGYTIQGEFKHNGLKNKLRHDKGVVSMARGSGYNTAGSQFFIALDNINMLNGYYAAFGKVIQGMESVEAIGKANSTLTKDETGLLTIRKMTVDTKLGKYLEPIVISIDPY